MLLVPHLQHGLTPHLVLGEGPVAADLARPGVDQLVIVSVARGFGFQVDPVKQLDLEEVEISKYNSILQQLVPN